MRNFYIDFKILFCYHKIPSSFNFNKLLKVKLIPDTFVTHRVKRQQQND